MQKDSIPGALNGVAAIEEEVAVDGNYDRRANPSQQTHTQANREQPFHTFLIKQASPENGLRMAKTGRIVNAMLFAILLACCPFLLREIPVSRG